MSTSDQPRKDAGISIILILILINILFGFGRLNTELSLLSKAFSLPEDINHCVSQSQIYFSISVVFTAILMVLGAFCLYHVFSYSTKTPKSIKSLAVLNFTYACSLLAFEPTTICLDNPVVDYSGLQKSLIVLIFVFLYFKFSSNAKQIFKIGTTT